MKKLVKAVAVLGLAAAMALPLAACGEAGKSAYDIAVEHGFVGTEEEWLESLRGPQGEQGEKGDKGDKGEQGDAGAPGATPSITINEDGYWVINGEVTDVKAEGEDGKDGQDGASGPMGPTGPAGVGIDSIETEIVDDGSGNFTTVITIILTDDTKYSFNLPGAAVSSGQEYEAGSSELFAELVKGGATSITLTDNVEVGEVLKISQDLTLDLNGKTLTVGSGIADGSAALRVEAGGKLTIDGNGTIDATEAPDGVVPVAAMGEGALVTVEGGTIKVDTPKESCLYAMYGGRVVVNGGTFINSCTEDYEYGGGPVLTVNVGNDYKVSDIVVNGGTFIGRDPALGDDNLGGTFVAEGYVSVPGENNTYTIVESDKVDRATYPVIAGTGAFKTLPDAVNAFNVAGKAPLANDALVVDLAAGAGYSLEGLSVVRDDVTLKGAGAESTTLTLTAAKSGQAGLEVAADGLTVQDMTIALASNVGDGNTSVIKPAFKAGDPVEGLKLIGLTLTGNDQGHGINLHCVNNATVSNVSIDNYGKCGIAIAYANGVTIEGVEFLEDEPVVSTENPDGVYGDIGLMYSSGENNKQYYAQPVVNVKIGSGNVFAANVVYSDITPAAAKEAYSSFEGQDGDVIYDFIWEADYGLAGAEMNGQKLYVSEELIAEQTDASVNGVYYPTVEDAIEAAENGDTVYLNGEIELTNQLAIDKSVILDGNGTAVISGGSFTFSGESTTIKNATFSAPENTNKNASFFYFTNNNVKEIVLEDCTFANPQWEVVQITSTALEKLIISGCTFTANDVQGAASDYGNTAKEAIRYIHIQPSGNTNIAIPKLVIVDNIFKDCENVKDSIAGLFFIKGSNLTIGGNQFEGLLSEGETESEKLCVDWPQNDMFCKVSLWTGEAQSFVVGDSSSSEESAG